MSKYVSLGIFLLMIMACAEKQSSEVAIYEQAKSLEADGKILEALAVYETLAPYEGTDVYKKAETELLAKGISIKSARSSWTIQKMIGMENVIFTQYKSDGSFPDSLALGDLTDAWGQKMLVEYQPSEAHLFKIRSKGPDGIQKTQDDLLLSYRDKYKFEQQKQSSGEITVGLDELSALGQSEETREITMGLDQFETVSRDSADVQEQVMDLKQLLKKNQ